jgi:hypothetical protein
MNFIYSKISLGLIFIAIISCAFIFQNLPLDVFDNMLDLKYGYSRNDVENVFNILGLEGRQIYVLSALILDTIFPILYVNFFIGIRYLLKLNRFSFVIFLILIGVIDILENIQIAVIMSTESFSLVSVSQIYLSSITTMAKWILNVLSIFITSYKLIRSKFMKIN